MSTIVLSYVLPQRLLVDLFPPLGEELGRAEVVGFKNGKLSLDLNNGINVTAKDVSILEAKQGKQIETGAKLHFNAAGEVIGVTPSEIKKVVEKPTQRPNSGSNASQVKKSLY